MPSGEAWAGPGAVLNNLFKRLGAEWDVWDVRNGRVTRFQQYVDTAKLRDVMGAR